MSWPRCRTRGQFMTTESRHAPATSSSSSRALTSRLALAIRGHACSLGPRGSRRRDGQETDEIRPDSSYPDRAMGILSRITLTLWMVIVGTIVMYVFFVAVATVSPSQVAGATTVVAALSVLFAIRSMRISSELAARGGDPALRRARNRARERRGF